MGTEGREKDVDVAEEGNRCEYLFSRSPLTLRRVPDLLAGVRD